MFAYFTVLFQQDQNSVFIAIESRSIPKCLSYYSHSFAPAFSIVISKRNGRDKVDLIVSSINVRQSIVKVFWEQS